MKKREEILKELKKIDISTSKIMELIEHESFEKLVKSQIDFDEAVMNMAKDRAKSDNPKTISGVKARIMNGKIIPKAGKEVEEVRDKYGLSIYGWSSMEWYRKTLPPK